MMIRFALLLLLISSFPATAQVPARQHEGEITSKAICTYITNRSDGTIMGTIATAPQRLPSGDMAKHEENFKLEAGKKRHFCASGPFYEGQRLLLTLRTMFPLFECKTKLDREIFLDSTRDADGVRHVSATCS